MKDKEFNKAADSTATPEKLQITVTFLDGTEEIINDVRQFGPVPNQNLLVITLMSGETVVYVLNENVRKYRFHVVK